ncbi:helix-turn-helix transcriptional regulator [Hyphobacterium sp.]|uniref:helix-turn-helix transcriptional regulator n=1 Tax=Hyphobacterium sp. TaxID=2004662 RepID=UPI003BA91CB1
MSINDSLRMPITYLLSPREVEKMMDVSRSTLQRLRKEPGFPEPVYITERTIRFYPDEITAFIEARKGVRS